MLRQLIPGACFYGCLVFGATVTPDESFLNRLDLRHERTGKRKLYSNEASLLHLNERTTLLFARTGEQMSVFKIKIDVNMIKPSQQVGPPSFRPSNRPFSHPFRKPEGKHIDECTTP